MKNLTDMFLNLNDLNIKYVVIDNWIGLPGNPPKEIEILCDKNDLVVRASGLTRVEKNLYKFVHGNTEEKKEEKCGFQLIRLYERGKGFLPSSFETELLQFAVKHQDIKVPPSDRTQWLAVYLYLAYKRNIHKDNTLKKCIIEHVKNRMGDIRKPEYDNLLKDFTL